MYLSSFYKNLVIMTNEMYFLSVSVKLWDALLALLTEEYGSVEISHNLASSLLSTVLNSTALLCVCWMKEWIIGWRSEWKGFPKIRCPLYTRGKKKILFVTSVNSWDGTRIQICPLADIFHNSLSFCFSQWPKFMDMLHYGEFIKRDKNHIFNLSIARIQSTEWGS